MSIRNQRNPATDRGKHQRAQQELYLAELRRRGTLTGGCRAAHISPHTVYWWREHDEEFVLRENEAQQVLTDALEEESIRRGLEGYQRPIYQRGELVGYETVYGDQLLNLHLGGPGTANGRRNFMSVIASSPRRPVATRAARP